MAQVRDVPVAEALLMARNEIPEDALASDASDLPRLIGGQGKPRSTTKTIIS
jgi:hypothetical protein